MEHVRVLQLSPLKTETSGDLTTYGAQQESGHRPVATAVIANVDIEIPLHCHEAAELLFDWTHEVERLEREAREAVRSTQADEWTLMEAECSQDLLAAELKVALARRPDRTTARTVEHLRACEARIDRLVHQLKALQQMGVRAMAPPS